MILPVLHCIKYSHDTIQLLNIVMIQFSSIKKQISKNYIGICNVFPTKLALVYIPDIMDRNH